MSNVLPEPKAMVAEQAEDEGLWFVAATAPEGYLQQELRRLHAAVEAAPDWKTIAGAWMRATADARIERDRLSALAAAASEMLRAPSISRINVGGETLARNELADRIDAAQAFHT